MLLLYTGAAKVEWCTFSCRNVLWLIWGWKGHAYGRSIQQGKCTGQLSTKVNWYAVGVFFPIVAVVAFHVVIELRETIGQIAFCKFGLFVISGFTLANQYARNYKRTKFMLLPKCRKLQNNRCVRALTDVLNCSLILSWKIVSLQNFVNS